MKGWTGTPAATAAGHFFRVPGKDKGGGTSGDRPEEAPEDQVLDEEEELILCRHCGRPVTRADQRIEVAGAHKHTFANPHGIVYEIGCFRSAFGCGYSGPTTDEFTWFKGYQWKVALCGSCTTHLGWRFSSASSEPFHGLILDRLKDSG